MANPLPSVTASAAFFIDFDGTLVPIVERYNEITVPPQTRVLINNLRDRFQGAVAIVSGRPLTAIDEFLAPLVMPVAAEHGAVRRDASGEVHRDFLGREDVVAVAERLAPLLMQHEGLDLERKESSAALHYRRRPELREVAEEAADAAIEGLSHVHLLKGKMVVEVKAEAVDKGGAVEAFLKEAPFAGREPVVIGDDRTDEDAFTVVNRLGGLSIKIGEGETVAQYRAAREDFLAWLAALAEGAA